MADSKWIGGLQATTPLADAARRALGVRLETVRQYLGLALGEADKDREYVHQLRVGTRRAGAARDIFACCLPEDVYRALGKHLRRIRRAAGLARDWDVFLMALPATGKGQDRPGKEFLTGYAVAQRGIAQDQLAGAGPDYPMVFEQLQAEVLAAVRPPLAESGLRTLQDLARPILAGLLKEWDDAAACDLTDYGNLHQVRIIGKRLRYAMELFVDCFGQDFRNELYPAVEEMQEILGRANDSHVASQRLVAARAQLRAMRPEDWKRIRPGIDRLLRSHRQRLPRERKHFLKWWSRWRESGAEAAFARLLQETRQQQ